MRISSLSGSAVGYLPKLNGNMQLVLVQRPHGALEMIFPACLHMQTLRRKATQRAAPGMWDQVGLMHSVSMICTEMSGNGVQIGLAHMGLSQLQIPKDRRADR